MDDLTNRTLGKYDVVEEVGRGSMGTVYLGLDPFTGRDVALKVANRDSKQFKSSGMDPRKLFFNEAKVAGMLKHPNIVAIFDAGIEGDIWYIVMEYLPGGRTLQSHCQPDTLLPIEDAVRIVFKCAIALDYAHRKGIIHRDVKPSNILLTAAGEAKIADFGVAMITRFDATQTQLRGYVGSPLYMSPEQVQDDDISTQSDLFSIGVVLYELLTGRSPFAADSLPAIMHNITRKPHEPLRELRHDAPAVLEHILDRTLRKNPKARYRTGMDLAGDLSLVFDELLLPAEEISAKRKYERVKRSKFFRDFTEPELWEVVNASLWHDFAPGSEIVIEGELDDSFYVIVSGEVEVLVGKRSVDLLGEGDCFGEMGFIAGRKRSATIVARSEVSVLQVRASLIERVSLPCQLRFHKIFLHTLVERLSLATTRTSERVIDP